MLTPDLLKSYSIPGNFPCPFCILHYIGSTKYKAAWKTAGLAPAVENLVTEAGELGGWASDDD